MKKTGFSGEYPTLSVKDEVTDFLLYTAPNSEVKVEVLLNDETLWLTQKRMAELFGVKVPTINEHLKDIFKTSELDENSVIRKFRTTAADGKNYNTHYYNLDAVISVGYRVNSAQATQFRIWATNLIKEYIIKGFAMDDERLKNGRYFGKDSRSHAPAWERILELIMGRSHFTITQPKQKAHNSSTRDYAGMLGMQEVCR